MGAAKTRSVAFGGILLALALICLFLAATMPISRLSFYVLSSFPVAIIVLEFGIGKAWSFYAASALLALLIVPEKIAIIPFIAFFGLYGIVKYYIEKVNKAVLEYVCKLAMFNSLLAIAISLTKEFLFAGTSILDKFPIWLIVLALQIVFAVYDYVYTRFIVYYDTKLKAMLKI